MTQLRRLFRFQNIPLGIVLVVPFVLEVMAAVGLTAYLSHQHGQTSIHRMADRVTTEVSDRVDQHLTHYLELPVQSTGEMATALQLDVLNSQDPLRLERYFKARLSLLNQSSTPLDLVILADRQNQLTAVEKAGAGRWTIYSRNSNTQNKLRGWALESDGTEQRSLYETTFGTTQDPFQEQSWYKQVQQTDAGLWHLIELPRSGQPKRLLTYFRPFRDGADVPLGVIGAAIDLENMSQFLKDQDVSPQGQAFIVDATGTLVAASTGEPFVTLQNPQQSLSDSLPDASDAIARSPFLAIRSTSTIIRKTARHVTTELGGFGNLTHQRNFTFQAKGKQYFVRVTPLRQLAGLNWSLVVAVPQSDFVAPMADHLETIMILSVGALIAAIALGLLTARQITRPIQRLNRASEALMLDKLDEPVEEHSRIRELAVMAHSFNKMTEHLFKSFDQVNLALQESKEKFTTVFRTSPDPIMISTLPDGKILEVNDSFLRLTGLPRETVVNSTAIELGLWSSLADRQKLMQAIAGTGRVCNQEVSTVTQHGLHLTVLLSSEKIELDGKECLLTIAKDITERKRLEEALRQSEAKLHDVLNSAAAAICYFYVDDAGQLRSSYFSAGAQTVFGYSPETLLAQPDIWQGRVVSEDWQTVIVPCLAQVVAGQSVAMEYRYNHPAGGIRWISADIITRWDKAQQRWLATSVEFDVTARKQAEESLRLSEECFRMAFDSATIGMDIAAPDGQLLRVNPALCQMLGYSETELLSCSYRNITHPDDMALDQAINLKILRGDVASQTFEKRFIHKDGQTIWTLLSLSLVRNLQQEPLYWVAQIQDITARKQAEQTVKESEARFRAVFETAMSGIAIATLNGNIMEANDPFCQITGYERTELQELKLQDLIHPDDLLRWLRLLQHLDTQWLDHDQLKVCCVRKGGQFQWVQLTTLLIRDAARHPLHLVVRMEILPFISHGESSDLTEIEAQQP